MAEQNHRRRQRRANRTVPPPATTADGASGEAREAEAKAGTPERRGKPGPRRARDSGAERGLRDLVGAGRSQLGVSGALRARDVNRPGEDDLAEAERDVVIVRRGWKPGDKRG